MTLEKRIKIDLAPVSAGLSQPLGLVGEAQKRSEFETYVAAVRYPIERAVFDVLSQAVSVFNEIGPEEQVRLEYGDGGLYLSAGSQGEPMAQDERFDDGDLERVTLRLPAALKRCIDELAESELISANSWYVRELSRAARRGMHGWHGLHGSHQGGRSGRRGRHRGPRGRIGEED